MTGQAQRIREAADRLPLDDRRELLRTLTESVTREEAEVADAELHPAGRAGELIAAAGQAVGRPIGRRSRTEDQVTGRMFVLDQLVSEGYTLTRASALLGKDHATGTHLRKRMAFMKAHRNAFPREMEMYDKFQALIYDFQQ